MTTAAEPRSDAGAAVPVEARSGYLPALDGLRALSVAAVLAFHLGHLRGGFLGVDVFFTISGFLITRLLLAEWERTGRIGLRAFWLRRFRRLLPALFLVLAVVALASKAWLPAWRLGDVRTDSLSALAYVANWRFTWSGQSYFTQGLGPSPVRHTWSLAIEEQFYVLWPLLVLGALVLARRSARRAGGARRAVGVLAGVATVASATWMAVLAGSAADLSRAYYGTDTRAFALGAGAWVATWWDPVLTRAEGRARRRRRATALAWAAAVAVVGLAVAVVVVSEDARSSYRGGFQLVAVLAAVAVAGLATGRGPLATVLGSAPLRWVGRRSYGIYLWSWPIQVLAAERFALGPRRLAVVVVVGSVLAAAVSYAVVEEPVRTGRWPWGATGSTPVPRRSPLPARAAAALGLAVTVAVVALPSVGSPPPPAYLRTSDQAALDQALAPASASGGPTTTAGPTTTVGPDAVGPFDASAPLVVPAGAQADPAAIHGRPLKVLLTGDSVAWSLGSFLGDGLTAPIELSDRGIIACGILPAAADWIASGNPPQNYPNYCSKQAEADRLGLQGGPDVVVLWTGAWEVYDHHYRGRTYRVGTERFATLLERLLQARIDRYRAAGLGTVLPLVTCFGPTPKVFGTERLDPTRIAWVNARLRAVAERNPGWVRMIDPEPVLCDADGTAKAAMPGGYGIRVDGAHFDEHSAPWFWNTWLAGQIAAAFDR